MKCSQGRECAGVIFSDYNSRAFEFSNGYDNKNKGYGE